MSPQTLAPSLKCKLQTQDSRVLSQQNQVLNKKVIQSDVPS